MLQHLYIKNYTLIDVMEIDFNIGFTVITGETGAGKSILLGALSLLLGKRADLSVLMDKEQKCVVEATFDVSKLELTELFEANDLDYERQTVIRREIVPSGKSRAFVNDTPVNLPLLKELGEKLVDIHSQHQTLLLNELDFQREVFDGYVNKPAAMKEYQTVYKQYKAVENKLVDLVERNQQERRDEDYVRFQLDELEAANLNVDEFRELEEKVQMLSHAEEISRSIEMARSILQESEDSVLDRLKEIKDSFSKISDVHPALKELSDRLNSSLIELSDLTREIDRFSGETDFDPADLHLAELRLDDLYRLQQKHHAVDMDELIRIRDEFRARLNAVLSLDEEIETQKALLQQLVKQLELQSKELHESRSNVVPKFEKEVEQLLKSLGMANAEFKVHLTQTERFTLWGKDKILFLFNANRGGTLSEISKSASGGELSRLMLALKSLVHQVKVLPTIIFDEIDSGVSGDIAGKVGNILKGMSNHLQVLTITHLPQIAAKANTHLMVYKSDEKERTTSRIEQLEENSRLEAIARMLSDEKITDAAKQAAIELLNN
ncbi:MAG: DNA repair protein RecN [Bacteroidales bacterium]|nr:DNA repair protein RecN [Bacteroidales bacterium]